MATIRQVRQRIKVAKNIQQITKAMKMVAAARLKRAQDRVQASRPYSEALKDVMTSVASTSGNVSHPLLEKRPVINTGFVIITSDRGLAGSYNSSIFRRANEMLKEYNKANVKLYCVGRKGIQFFSRRNYNVVKEFQIGNTLTVQNAQDIVSVLKRDFEEQNVDQIILLYTRFFTAITQKPTDIQLLPMSTPQVDASATPNMVDYIFEPDAKDILKSLIPRYLEGLVYQALLESTASEHGSRMTAMSNATENAGKMIQTLTLQMNRVRQAGITREISEIVGGAEALKS